MKPIVVLLISVNEFSSIAVIFEPLIKISPLVGLSNPAMTFKRVVLPDPDLPTIAMNWPSYIFILMSRKGFMFSDSETYDLDTFINSRSGF